MLHLIGPQKGPDPFPKHVSYQVWLNLAKWFLRRNYLKEKITDNTDGGRIVS